MTPRLNHQDRPTWLAYTLTFVLVTGGLALSTYALTPLLVGGMTGINDKLRSLR